MPKALLTGGSSKFGAVLRDVLELSYDVEVIPRGVLKGMGSKYNARSSQYDLVFFNHNMPADDGFDTTPQTILNSISYANRVGWMVTAQSLNLQTPMPYMTEPELQNYVAQKAIYITQMRSYATKYKTFVCDPSGLNENNYLRKAMELAEFTQSDYESGSILRLK